MTDIEARQGAPLPQPEFTLSIEEAGELYAQAGFGRTKRRLQKYCARGDLDCRKVETVSGEKYLINATSVERHITQIRDAVAASGHDPTRSAAPGRSEVESHKIGAPAPAPSDAPARSSAPTISDISVFEHPYVKRLEREVEEFKGKFETQVRRTEQVLETANRNLIELQQASAIAQSETLARYMLASASGKPAIDRDTPPTPGPHEDKPADPPVAA